MTKAQWSISDREVARTMRRAGASIIDIALRFCVSIKAAKCAVNAKNMAYWLKRG